MINVKLDEKPTSVSIRYNGYYKLVLLLAILQNCAYAKKGSFELIHIVFWSLRSDYNYRIVMELTKGERRNLVPWSFEHGVDEVLSLGLMNGFLKRMVVSETLEIQITAKGQEILASINQYELFAEEISKISALGIIPKYKLVEASKKWTLI